jgi:hypothetical protein
MIYFELHNHPFDVSKNITLVINENAEYDISKWSYRIPYYVIPMELSIFNNCILHKEITAYLI